MFTGIIEDFGIIKKITRNRLAVATKLDGIKPGDSICINGACLTVINLFIVHCSSFIVQADISEETLRRTNLGNLKPGSKVNLELAMKADGRFGGHFVTGHVDGIGRIEKIEKLKDFKIIKFSVPENLSKHIAVKGSVAVDGISLTVAEVKPLPASHFRLTVSIIPYTLENTTLGIKKTGDTVNIETDILAKYVLQTPAKKEITLEILKKSGFTG